MSSLWRKLVSPPEAGSWSEMEWAVESAFRVLLLRAPEPGERRERARALASGQPPDELDRALLGSAEFRQLYDAYGGGSELPRNAKKLEEILSVLGDPRAFVSRVYRSVLGRDADDAGGDYYATRLAEGATRASVVKALVQSDEFEARYQRICPQAGLVPRDVQLCELANPAKWDNPDWVSLLRSVGTVPADKLSMHRKAYEYAQTLFGLSRLGFLRDDARIVSVGAGHESILYWLANRVGLVAATDRYDETWKAARAGEGDEEVARKPEDFAPFPYRRERLVFAKMDGQKLGFRDGVFDAAYSLSSIEHFGGFGGARAAIEEMARVVQKGGVLAVATEYLVSGPQTHETFRPEEIHALVDHPELRLIQPLDENVHQRYETAVVDLRTNPYQTPQMLVRDHDTVFTSVMLFLSKQ